MISDDEPLRRKDITAKLMGIPEDESGCLDLDAFCEEKEEAAAADAQPTPDTGEQQNAITDIIDILLDLSSDFLPTIGYPAPNRAIWEQRGKRSMNRALNAYFPPTATTAGISSPAVALAVGIIALGFCMYPVIMHLIKSRKEAAAEEQPPEPEAEPSANVDTGKPKQEPQPQPIPAPAVTESNGDGNGEEPPNPEAIAAILRQNHAQFNTA